MALPGFFRQHKHKRFNYKPVYYDQQKEELEERVKGIEAEMGIKHDGVRTGTRLGRGNIRNYFNSKKQKRERSGNVRLLIILMFLLLIAYYLFYH